MSLKLTGTSSGGSLPPADPSGLALPRARSRPAHLNAFLSTDVLFTFLPVYCSAAIQRLLCGRKGKRGTKAHNQSHRKEMVMRAHEGDANGPRVPAGEGLRVAVWSSGLLPTSGRSRGFGSHHVSTQPSSPQVSGVNSLEDSGYEVVSNQRIGFLRVSRMGSGYRRLRPSAPHWGRPTTHLCARDSARRRHPAPTTGAPDRTPHTEQKQQGMDEDQRPRTAATVTLSPAPELPFAGVTAERGVLSAHPGGSSHRASLVDGQQPPCKDGETTDRCAAWQTTAGAGQGRPSELPRPEACVA